MLRLRLPKWRKAPTAPLFFLLLLGGCSSPEPLEIGFVAGLSGRVADLGIAGRNGVMLAIEERNAQGGIHGRPVRLVIKDDRQDPEIAHTVVQELIDQRVAMIIGHMTSSMSVATVPLVNRHQMVMLSPTTTTDILEEKDDYFLRVISSTKVYAEKNAQYQRRALGLKTIAAAIDTKNLAYTWSWLANFKSEFEKFGGEVITEIEFASSPELHYSDLAKQLLSGGPDGLLIISSGMDAALLSQQIRKFDPQVHISTSEWAAASDQLLKLGGHAVDEILIAQFFDRDSETPRYKTFAATFRARFQSEPGFASIAGYDAAQVALDALSRNPDPRQLKQTLLSTGTFSGVQSTIKIDRFGDAFRPTYLTRIKDGQYHVIREQ